MTLDEQLAIRVPVALMDMVRELAAAEERTPSNMVRVLLKEAIDARKRRKEKR